MKSNSTITAYETTYISKADTTDDAQKAFLEKLKGIIQAHGGETIAVEDWGRRKLAYTIQKESRGVYTYVLYTGNNSLVAELERNLRINEQVIRFLTVQVEKEYDAANFKRRPTANFAHAAAAAAALAVPASSPAAYNE